MAPRILCGTTAHVEPAVLRASLASIRSQRLPKGASLDLCYVIDDPDRRADLKDVLADFDSEWLHSSGPPTEYDTTGQTHNWNEQLFDHVGQNKDRLIQKAVDESYDYLWFVDTDLIVSDDALWSMMATNLDLVSAVFWTFWNAAESASLGPNVWLQHPYSQQGLGMKQPEFWRRLADRRITPIAGGGACILLNRRALESGLRYYPRIENLPDHGMYRGEDRSFAIRAKQRHLNQAADPWPDVFHLYHPEERTAEYVNDISGFMTESTTMDRTPDYGDLVNLRLTSLDRPELSDLPVRGRLGGLNMAPELEAAIMEMSSGDNRIVEVVFPPYWPSRPNESTMLQVELVSTKPFGFAPNLAEVAFRGIQ